MFKLKGSGITRLRFTGGEPTLYPDFEEILCLASKLDILFAIFTNGRWKEPERLVEFLKGIPQFQSVLVSLHGLSPEAHEVFTGIRWSFQETVDNVKLAVDAGVTVNTNTVITAQNYAHIEQMIDFAHTLGVSTAIIARYIGKPVSEIEITPEQLKQAVERVEKKRIDGVGIKFSACIPSCFVQSSATGCTAGYTFLTVDPWGNVRPCNHASIICGNLLQLSVAEVWHSKPMEQWRSFSRFECKHCLAFARCHGGCRAAAMAYGLTADPLMGEPIIDESPAQLFQDIVLDKAALPMLSCQVRRESFGYLLIHGIQTTPVSHEAQPILNACDGTVTLEAIRGRFGQEGLDFVGTLVERGFIELSAPAKQV